MFSYLKSFKGNTTWYVKVCYLPIQKLDTTGSLNLVFLHHLPQLHFSVRDNLLLKFGVFPFKYKVGKNRLAIVGTQNTVYSSYDL